MKKVEDFSILKSNFSELKQELNSYICDSFTFLEEIQEKLDQSHIKTTVTDYKDLKLKLTGQEEFLIWQQKQFDKLYEGL